MLDKDIRTVLTLKHLSKYRVDGSSKIVEEMGVCIDDSRIDVAVINGHFHGFEIKSNQDNFSRLNSQLHDYSKVFDYLTFVVGDKHTHSISAIIPDWCGIIEASYKGEELVLKSIKKASINKNTDVLSIAQLLWKDECITLLKSRNVKGFSGKNKLQLWKMVAEYVPKKELSFEVRAMLKARLNWRAEPMLSPCDGC